MYHIDRFFNMFDSTVSLCLPACEIHRGEPVASFYKSICGITRTAWNNAVLRDSQACVSFKLAESLFEVNLLIEIN